MAGSSVPTTWRRPPADVRRDARLREIVAITYHTTDAYGFHALEMVEALAEQRRGGETGIQAVQSLAGDAVWRAFDEGGFDTNLFEAAWQRLSHPQNRGRPLREAVQNFVPGGTKFWHRERGSKRGKPAQGAVREPG